MAMLVFPTISSFALSAKKSCVQTFFGGSLKQMMTSLVAEGSWSDEELELLKTEIDRVRKERKPKP